MITLNLITYNPSVIGSFSQNLSLKRFVPATVQACKVLDRNSMACRFFGVDSRQNVMLKLDNHVKLALLKSKDSGILPSFPKRTYFSVDKPYTMYNAWNNLWTACKGKKFDELYTNPARLTFDGNFFGENGDASSHTIGVLYEPHSKILYCLDSLSNSHKQVQKYQNILKNMVFNSPNGEIRRIIFSNKPQQNLNEYTCNNWAIANIEALQKALKSGKNIDSTSALNDILPDDINAVLREQYEYVLRNW